MKNYVTGIFKNYKLWYIFMVATNTTLSANLFLYAFTGLTFLRSTEGSVIAQICVWVVFVFVILITLSENEHKK